ncbi:hypothetical protein [Streptosporangium sp. NPDC000239]|uniref:Secreted protein n=1 Tax=Streptosporangium jomthongense TaxID=1193683 RepID=A0ABV8FA35_9ACTN
MRRSVHLLAALGAAALTLLPTTAMAAHGRLVFGGGQVVENPSGCVDARLRPLILRNETNEYALVYSGPNCTGQIVAVVQPGGRTTQEFGSSVFVA